MNSDDERRIFTRWGWSYDQIERAWVAPDGYRVTLDDLVTAAEVIGEAVERRIVEIARQHGRVR